MRTIIIALSACALLMSGRPADAQTTPTPTLPPGPHFSSASSVVFKATGPLSVLYVDYDPLHYTNAKVTLTTKTVDAPDLTKVFSPLTGGGPKRTSAIAQDVSDIVGAINTKQSERNCRNRRARRDYYQCRVTDIQLEIDTLAAIYKRDAARADAVLDPQTGPIAKEVLSDDVSLANPPKDAQSPTITIPRRSKSTSTDLTNRLTLDPTQTWDQVIVHGFVPAPAPPTVPNTSPPGPTPTPMPTQTPTPFLPSGRPPQPAALPTCAPVLALTGDRSKPADPIGLIEITDGCAQQLASELIDLSKTLANDKRTVKAADRPDLDAVTEKIAASQKALAPYVTGGQDATAITAYHGRLAQVDVWAKRFAAVTTNDFSIGTSAPCNTGAGGTTATVHFSANDRFAGTIDPKKPDVDKDVVVVTCYSPFSVGAAGGWSLVPQTTFSVQQSSVQTNGPSAGSPPSPAPTFQSFYQIQQSQNQGRTVAGVFLHRCICQNPSDGVSPYLSFALGASSKDFPNLLAGFSLGFNHQYFLTLSGHYASDATLTSSNKVGDFVPSGYSLQTGKRYVIRPALTFGIATGK